MEAIKTTAWNRNEIDEPIISGREGGEEEAREKWKRKEKAPWKRAKGGIFLGFREMAMAGQVFQFPRMLPVPRACPNFFLSYY